MKFNDLSMKYRVDIVETRYRYDDEGKTYCDEKTTEALYFVDEATAKAWAKNYSNKHFAYSLAHQDRAVYKGPFLIDP